MTSRGKAKKSGSDGQSSARTGSRKAAAQASAEADAGALEAENRALRAALDDAKAEIARLQKRQELVVNRIDWVVDSLHNLLEDED